jgi:sigma-B regulation protein RsbU (phosphoserine phosphatase)
MAEQADSGGRDFSDRISRLAGSADELDKVLARLLELLSGQGIKPSIDITGIMRRVQKDVGEVQKTSDRVFTQLAQMQALVDTSALITSSLDLDQVLEGVIDTVIKLTGAERAYLMLRDTDSGQLSIRAARNWDQQSMSSGEVVFSEGVIQTALEQGTPIVTVNAQDDARFQDRESVMSHGLRSILCIPLVLREARIGVLYADNRVSLGVFQEQLLPLLTAFANQAAIAIENARLFEKVKADLDKAEREVQVLRLQIDREKLSRQVSEITDTEYFQQLEDMARSIRGQSDKEDDD